MTTAPSNPVLSGAKALVVGIANEHSIAYGCARALRELGADLAVTYLNEKARPHVEPVARRLDAGIVMPLDVGEPGQLEAVFGAIERQWGRLDILVTAAGTAAFGPLAEGKPADWEPMLAVNLRAAMVCCHAVLPVMRRQRSGTILNVASIAAKRALPGGAVYAATKAGIAQFSRVLAEELRGQGIRVGVLFPGAVDTPLWDAIPAGPARERMLRPEDVARAAVLMAALPARASLEELTLLPEGGIL